MMMFLKGFSQTAEKCHLSPAALHLTSHRDSFLAKIENDLLTKSAENKTLKQSIVGRANLCNKYIVFVAAASH